MRLHWIEPAFEAIHLDDPFWVPHVVHPYLDLGEEVHHDLLIELQIPSFGAGYTAALLGLPNDGLPVLAPHPWGPLVAEGIPVELSDSEESVDVLPDRSVERAPSAMEGIPVDASKDEEPSYLAMSSDIYLLFLSCSFLLLASASLSTFCSSLALQ